MRRFLTGSVRWLAALAVLALTGWGALALAVVGPGGDKGRLVLAAAYGVAGLAAVVALVLHRGLRFALPAFAVALVAIAGWWSSIQPSNERDWQPEVARLAYATIDGDRVTVHNVRNFDYRTETDFTPAYYDRTYDLKKLDSGDLLAVYWMGPAIAHIFVSLRLRRRPPRHLHRDAQGEGRGLLLGSRASSGSTSCSTWSPTSATWSASAPTTARPAGGRLRLPARVPRRTSGACSSTTCASERAARAAGVLQHAHHQLHHRDPHEHPREPGLPPLLLEGALSGYAPAYVYESGRIDRSLPFEELQRRSLVNAAAQAADQAPDFSRRIRAGLPGAAGGR